MLNKLTVYEVMKNNAVIIAVDVKNEHVVSWDQKRTFILWIETDGWYEKIELRTLLKDPEGFLEVTEVANRLLLNVDEDPKRVLYNSILANILKKD